MRGKGNRHLAANHALSANLLLNLADLAGIPLEKIGPSTGRLDI